MKLYGKSLITKIFQVIVMLSFMIILMWIYSRIIQNQNANEKKIEDIAKKNELFSTFENDYVYLTKYTVYGNHLNISGYIKEQDDVDNIEITLKNLDGEENSYSTNFQKNNDLTYSFDISKNINEGINLDNLSEDEYYLLIKTTKNLNEQDKVIKYYSIKNTTNYDDLEYYSTTINSINFKEAITFSSYNEKDYMAIGVKKINTLPENVYDVVIDPGHGGKDTGAIFQDIQEKEYTLKISLALKEKLESLGYKVKLTRQNDEYVAPYGEGGRTLCPYESHAKLFLSIHLNSTDGTNDVGGVEIYSPNNANLDMAKELANNLVNTVGINYSQNNINKVFDGVYVRTYTQDEIKEAYEYAKKAGYEPYESITTQTPYYFMTRETGGIMTGAYVDGRNKEIGDNPYYNSNISAECYLLELGFVNCSNDMEKIKNNMNLYVDSISNVIVNHYNYL